MGLSAAMAAAGPRMEIDAGVGKERLRVVMRVGLRID
jgi:hypothetical protein